MKKVLRRRSDLVGIQAIYHKGKLIYREHQGKTEMEGNQVHVVDKKDMYNRRKI